jgi:hypothetical protein
MVITDFSQAQSEKGSNGYGGGGWDDLGSGSPAKAAIVSITANDIIESGVESATLTGAGVLYTAGLTSISSWLVKWGDGTSTTYYTSGTSPNVAISHTYTSTAVGMFSVTIRSVPLLVGPWLPPWRVLPGL